MPKVFGPLFSFRASGKFGKNLIFKRGGVVTSAFVPKNPNTELQQAQRQFFKENYVMGLTQQQADLLYAAILHIHDDLYSRLGHTHDLSLYLTQALGDDRYLQIANTPKVLKSYYSGENFFSIASLPGGASAWTGQIESIAVDRLSLVWKSTGTTGTAAAMVPANMTALSKMRLFNVSNSPVDYALVANCNTSTRTITFASALPVTWAINENLSIASQIVSGGGSSWVDLEVTDQNLVDRGELGLTAFVRSATVGNLLKWHPLEPYGAGKVGTLPVLVANNTAFGYFPVRLVGRAFSISWTGTPANVGFYICQREE
jgi:hypothetical protein